MRNKLLMGMLLASLPLYSNEKASLELNEIPVTANPLGLSVDEMFRPVYIMNGLDLSNNKSSSLGSTLEKVPGISNSSWGDNIGRPVIRGMDRNRIKILNNGMQIKDVSNVSGDHVISIDTLSSEQIEVIRGPESIIYGGGAIGGIINIID